MAKKTNPGTYEYSTDKGKYKVESHKKVYGAKKEGWNLSRNGKVLDAFSTKKDALDFMKIHRP